MAFVILGLALLAMKLAGFGAVAEWGWWWVLSPFAAAAAWWAFADHFGLTKKREMDKMELRKEERRKKNLVSLGIEVRERRPK